MERTNSNQLQLVNQNCC